MRGLTLLVALLACDGEEPSYGEDCASWEEGGAPVALTYCAPCHATGQVGEARKGAPEGVDLASAEGVLAWQEAVETQLRADAMPPGGGPTSAEIEHFLGWLDCARSSDAAPLPAGAHDPGLLQGRETLVDVELDAADPSLLVVWTAVVGGDADGRVGTWSADTYAVEAETAALVSRALYDADGAVAFYESWDPALLIWEEAAGAGWTFETNEAWEAGDRSGGGAQTWEVTVGVVSEPDARLGDQAATEIRASLRSGEDGATTALGWWTAPALSLAGWSWTGADEAGEAITESHMQLTVAFPFEDLPGFPLEEGLGWQGRLLREASP